MIKRSLIGISYLKFVGSRLVSRARYLSAWDLHEFRELYRLPIQGLQIVSQPGGELLLVRTRQEYVLVDANSGEVAQAFSCHTSPWRVVPIHALSACGDFVIEAAQAGVVIRDLRTGRVVWKRELERAFVTDISPLQNGQLWVLCIQSIDDGRAPARPSRMEIWCWPFGSEPASVLEFDRLDFGVAVSNAGLIALPGYSQRPVRLMEIGTGRITGECLAPAGNANSGQPHWLSDQELAIAWQDRVHVHRPDGSLRRAIHAPGCSQYSVAASVESMALTYHDGFIVFPSPSGSDSGGDISIFPPWIEGKPIATNESPLWSRFVPATTATTRTLDFETDEALKEDLSEFARPAWVPNIRFGAGDVVASKLGGTAFIGHDEEWPSCGLCARPLELLLQLNTRDLPAELAHRFTGLLQVFVCTAVSRSRGGCALGNEAFPKAALVRLCTPEGSPRYQSPPFEDSFIEGTIESWNRRADYPSYYELQELGLEFTDLQSRLLIDDREELNYRGDKLSGWPHWPQCVEYTACPHCGQRTDVIFQIASYCTLPHCFMDGGTAWISQCPSHAESLAVTWNS